MVDAEGSTDEHASRAQICQIGEAIMARNSSSSPLAVGQAARTRAELIKLIDCLFFFPRPFSSVGAT